MLGAAFTALGSLGMGVLIERLALHSLRLEPGHGRVDWAPLPPPCELL